MERAKLISLLSAAGLALFLVFVAGLYSAHHENRADRAIQYIVDTAQTLRDEIPNLRGTAPIHFLTPARYPGRGVTVNDGGDPDDLILLSGMLEDDNKVRLMRRDGTVVNEWRLRAFDLMPDVRQCRKPPMTDWNAIAHGTIIAPDGSIVISFESCGAIKLDRCGKKLWQSTEKTHHSPNWTPDGGIIVAGGEHVETPTADLPWPLKGPYWEDLVYVYAPDGRMRLRVAATEMFLRNGMAPLLNSGSAFETRVDGEFHLNDLEVLSPGMAAAFPMFAAGDILMSFRNLNMVLVADSTAQVVKWVKVGPWVRQHDPDFNPDGTITVFGNQSDNSLQGTRMGGSRVWRIDPATDVATLVYGGRDGQRFYSAERGTHQMQPDGHVMVTEAQAGRAFEVDAAGRIVWEYVNRYDADRAAWLHDAETIPAGYLTVPDWTCDQMLAKSGG